jgi:hypothetical protein
MPKGIVKPRERDIRRAYRSLTREGASIVRVEVEAETGNLTFILDGEKSRPPIVDVLEGMPVGEAA